MPIGGRNVVIDHEQRLVGRADLALGEPQPLERLRARHLMDEMAVDIDEAGAVRLFVDQMVFPDFIVESAGFGHSGILLAVGALTPVWGVI